MKKTFFLKFFLIFIVASSQLWSLQQWQTLKSPHFFLYYPKGSEAFVKRCVTRLEHYRKDIIKLTGNKDLSIFGQKNYRIPLLFENYGTTTNAYADSLRMKTSLAINGMSTANISLVSIGLASDHDWCLEAGTHELIHMHHMTATRGVMNFLRRLFGRLSWQPHHNDPRWFTEGLAVYGESSLISPSFGRLNEGMFSSMIAVLAKKDQIPHPLLAQYPRATWENSWYLYGSRFVAYLAKTYGRDSIAKFIQERAGYFGFAGLFLDANFATAFGEDLETLWEEWIDSEKKEAQNFKIDGIRLTHKGRKITHFLLSNDEKNLYYTRTKYLDSRIGPTYKNAELYAYNIAKKTEKILYRTSLHLGSSMKEHEGHLYFAAIKRASNEILSPHFIAGGDFILMRFSLKSHVISVLYQGQFVDYEILNKHRILLVSNRPHSFGSIIQILDTQTGKLTKHQKLSFRIGEIIRGSKKSTFYVTAKDQNHPFHLHRYDLAKKKLESLQRVSYFQSLIQQQGDQFIYTANPNKKYNVFSYHPLSKTTRALTEGSFALGGKLTSDNSHLYFVGLNEEGFDLYVKKLEYPKLSPVKKEKLADPKRIEQEEKKIQFSPVKFSPMSFLDKLYLLAPYSYQLFAHVRNEELLVRWNLFGEDPTGNFSYAAGFSYNWVNKKPSMGLQISSQILSPLLMELLYFSETDRSLTTESRRINNIPRQFVRKHVFFTKFGWPLSFKNTQYSNITQIQLVSGWPLENNAPDEDALMLTTKINTTDWKNNFHLYQFSRSNAKNNNEFSLGYEIGLTTTYEISTRQYARGNFYVIRDKAAHTNPMPYLRITGATTYERAGVGYSFEYGGKLITLRKGIWMFGFPFIEGMYGKIFSDHQKSSNHLFSIHGIEISTLSYLALSLMQVNLIARLGIDQDEKFARELSASLNFSY